MKKSILSILFVMLFLTQLQAQEIFNGLSKGPYRKTVEESDKITIPQFSINFETYTETKVVVQEGKLSKLQNTFEAASKGGQYGGSQSGSAKTTTILNSPLELADFQELANDFQLILEEEIGKAGKNVLPLKDLVKTDGYAKMQEKYSSKTASKGKNNSDENVGVGQIKMFPENSLFMFDEKSVTRGGGVPFVTMMRNFNKETGAVVMLNNVDVDFSTVELNVSLDAGTQGKTTSADTKIFPKMRISRNTMDFIGKGGAPSTAPATLVSEYVANKEYEAKIYKDTAKSKSLIDKMTGSGAKIDFDPFIVEMSKDTYKQAARDLFRQYAQDLAKALVVGAN
ncbi:hypothetical protein [Algoriphagus sp. AK58]|uniref:hypothetical protein n=1 Tax=Algoriphagus sp. AK58 TaxID=1406877 RepID=UPI00165003CC|nr:hypothetical protein [Algoriphagus sp. AK58]MBC6367962.1 hypothetical protein [Algoriphagus sp. AK58]